MRSLFRNFYPVCYLSEDNLLLFKRGTFYDLNIASSEIRKLAQIELTLKEKIFYMLPLLARTLRMGIRCSMRISENIVLFVIGNTIYELNLQDGTISLGYSTDDKCRPLAFSNIDGISGFEDGIYFGGYISNPFKKPIAIYKRISIDKWIIVFQFQEGAIEHIHNIVADKYSGTIFIFTGDFNHSAGIWIAKDNFTLVEPILIGDQNFRGCVAFPTAKGLVYATDAPFTVNSIRILIKDAQDKWVSKEVGPINGSCIYGCEWNNDFVFSTAVEGDGRDQNIIYKLFGTRRGMGIKDNLSYVYKGDLENGFKIIYAIKKDTLPFFLFQFGVLIFPSGKNNSNFLPIYHIATKKHSMSTLLLSK